VSAIGTLVSPLHYVAIRHPLKKVVDLWAPLAASCGGTIVVMSFSGLNLFGTSGLVPGINSLLQIMAGFFITSLAVISTFNGSIYKMDDVFEGEPALLFGKSLTRRQFLSHLFAYLALCSIAFYFMGIAGVAVATSIQNSHAYHYRDVLRALFSVIYLGGFGHVVGTTLIGLVFLSSRMTRVSKRDRYLVGPKETAESKGGVPSDC
jgi:hypothetical protein